MTASQTLTLSEAGYVLDRSPTAINKVVDTGVIRARQRRVGKVVQRLLGPAELRFLLLAEQLEGDLTPAGRRRLYGAVKRLASDAHRLTLGEIVLDLVRIDEELHVRLQRLERIRQKVDVGRDHDEPVIHGTAIPVYMVAALAREETTDEILDDYPSLTKEQVEAAVEYAKAYPKRGRPYPGRSLKRTLADLAEIGVFEQGEERLTGAPRKIP
ncbi:DUF433 domain-containing protein [uncultured Bradyrhizobium sp.]|uniref:DUF433 domain-containing protein n=1 Tax=uncultured Bradyrhizobium sp. TaxID=199684 RepID=UPI00261E4F07|nr:DUF433 domain-containing protein [uncultured Bradyrhizobium sp.]